MSVSLNSKKLSYSIGKMNVALDLNFKTYYVSIGLFSNAYSTPFSLNLNYDSNYLRWYLNMELVINYNNSNYYELINGSSRYKFELNDGAYCNKLNHNKIVVLDSNNVRLIDESNNYYNFVKVNDIYKIRNINYKIGKNVVVNYSLDYSKITEIVCENEYVIIDYNNNNISNVTYFNKEERTKSVVIGIAGKNLTASYYNYNKLADEYEINIENLMFKNKHLNQYIKIENKQMNYYVGSEIVSYYNINYYEGNYYNIIDVVDENKEKTSYYHHKGLLAFEIKNDKYVKGYNYLINNNDLNYVINDYYELVGEYENIIDKVGLDLKPDVLSSNYYLTTDNVFNNENLEVICVNTNLEKEIKINEKGNIIVISAIIKKLYDKVGLIKASIYNDEELIDSINFKLAEYNEGYQYLIGRIETSRHYNKVKLNINTNGLKIYKIILDNRNVKKYSYDNEYRLVRICDNQNNIRYEYENYQVKNIWNNGQKISNYYDNLGRIEFQRYNNSLYSYDIINKDNVKTYEAIGIGLPNACKLISVKRNKADNYGNIVSKIDENEYETALNYDEKSRLTKVIDSNNNSYEINYNNDDTINKIVDNKKIINYQYDSDLYLRNVNDYSYNYDNGQISEVLQNNELLYKVQKSKGLIGRETGNSGEILYEYDLKNRLINKIDNGNGYKYEYNNDSLLINADEYSYSYNLNNKIIGGKRDNFKYTYYYDNENINNINYGKYSIALGNKNYGYHKSIEALEDILNTNEFYTNFFVRENNKYEIDLRLKNKNSYIGSGSSYCYINKYPGIELYNDKLITYNLELKILGFLIRIKNSFTEEFSIIKGTNYDVRVKSDKSLNVIINNENHNTINKLKINVVSKIIISEINNKLIIMIDNKLEEFIIEDNNLENIIINENNNGIMYDIYGLAVSSKGLNREEVIDLNELYNEYYLNNEIIEEETINTIIHKDEDLVLPLRNNIEGLEVIKLERHKILGIKDIRY